MTTLETLTVGQYQELFAIHTSEMDDLDKVIQSVCVLTGKSESEVEEMSLSDFNKTSSTLATIFSKQPDSKPKRFLQINSKEFGVTYEPRYLSAGQYIEIQTWIKEGYIQNIHKIMASLVYPVKRKLFRKVRGKYDAEQHPEISEGIKDCLFIDIHSACVFFCQLWKASMESLRGYLVKDLLNKGMRPKEIQMILQLVSDGSTMQGGSQSLN